MLRGQPGVSILAITLFARQHVYPGAISLATLAPNVRSRAYYCEKRQNSGCVRFVALGCLAAC